MNGWAASDYAIVKAVGASVTDQAISREFPVTAGGAVQGMMIKVKFSGVTVSTAITAKLQTAIGSDWVDNKTASVAGNGAVYIKLLATDSSDWTYMPLLNRGRIVLTTGSGDAATVVSCEVLQPL